MALSVLTLSAFSLFFFPTWYLLCLVLDLFWLAWVPKHLLCATYFCLEPLVGLWCGVLGSVFS